MASKRTIPDNVNLVLANAYGLYTKKDKSKVNFLKELAITEKASFICITETHLSPTIKTAEVKMEGYVLHRADRSADRRRGGVTVYVKEKS